jgi:hypothetical protein
MKNNKFIDKIYTPDNRIEYIPNEVVCVRYSLRYTKLLSDKEVFTDTKEFRI